MVCLFRHPPAEGGGACRRGTEGEKRSARVGTPAGAARSRRRGHGPGWRGRSPALALCDPSVTGRRSSPTPLCWGDRPIGASSAPPGALLINPRALRASFGFRLRWPWFWGMPTAGVSACTSPQEASGARSATGAKGQAPTVGRGGRGACPPQGDRRAWPGYSGSTRSPLAAMAKIKFTNSAVLRFRLLISSRA